MSSAFARSRRNVFAGFDIERDADGRDDPAVPCNTRLAGEAARFVLLREDGQALLDAGANALRVFRHEEFARHGGVPEATIHLGRAQGSDWFAWRSEEAAANAIAAAVGGEFADLRAAAAALGEADAGLFAYARAMQQWQQRTRFCSVCGARLVFVEGGRRARCGNPHCAAEHFPRTDPAVIALIVHDDACLLGRQPNWPARRYSCLAGFVEPGETLEQAMCREAFEEAGVRLVDGDYHSSQPWPFPASIMLAFTARAADRKLVIGAELEDARWFTAQRIADALRSGELSLPPPISVAYRLIEDWLRHACGVELDALPRAAPAAGQRA